MSEKEINGLKTEEKIELIGLCQKLVPLGAVEFANELEEIIDKHIINDNEKIGVVTETIQLTEKNLKNLKEGHITTLNIMINCPNLDKYIPHLFILKPPKK